MNTCAFLLILTVQIYADGIEGPTGKLRIHLYRLERSWEVLTCGRNSTCSKSRASLAKVPTLCPRPLTRCCVYLRLTGASHDLRKGKCQQPRAENKIVCAHKFINWCVKFCECQTPAKMLGI